MREALAEEKVGEYTVKVFYDEGPWSPRENDELGTIVYWDRSLDRRPIIDESGNAWRTLDGFRTWLADTHVEWKDSKEDIIEFPLCGGSSNDLYIWDGDLDDHRIRGFIYAFISEIQKEFSLVEDPVAVRLWAETTGKVRERFEHELETYSEYLRGEVYGYVITNADGEQPLNMISSCWGFMGGAEIDGKKLDAVQYCLREGVEQAKAEIRYREKEDRMAEMYMVL